MESLASAIRQFVRLSKEGQDEFLEFVLDLLPENRLRDHLRRAMAAQDDVDDSIVLFSVDDLMNRILSPEQVPLPDVLTGVIRRRSQSPSAPRHANASIQKPVHALDAEYVESERGISMLHSVAIVRSIAGCPLFMIANHAAPLDSTSRSRLAGDVRRSSRSSPHHADTNTIKATVRSIAEMTTLVLWDAQKEIDAFGLQDSDQIIDLAPKFKRTDGSRCSLRATYFHFFDEDIFERGRDPRASARAILMIYREVLPIIRGSGASLLDSVPTNPELDERLRLRQQLRSIQLRQ